MSEPLIGEIRMFAGTFAPAGWALCNGQLLPIAQNAALFSILGNTYGGDGKTNFGLPDLRGRSPLSAGQGSGLSNYSLGQSAGAETAALSSAQLPAHTHPLNCATGTGGVGMQASPAGGVPAIPGAARGLRAYNASASAPTPMNGNAVLAAGNSSASVTHNNMAPYLAVNFIIALQGLFPSRN